MADETPQDRDFEVIQFNDGASDGKSGGPSSHVDRQDNYTGPGSTEGPFRLPTPDMGKAFEDALGGAVKVAGAAVDLAGKITNVATGKGNTPVVVVPRNNAADSGIPIWAYLLGGYLIMQSMKK